jgi:hypothetical protein
MNHKPILIGFLIVFCGYLAVAAFALSILRGNAPEPAPPRTNGLEPGP